MKIIDDKTGRFRKRVYYEENELDYECEDIVTSFLIKKHGNINYPITTDDLTVLIEQKTSDFDLYADLQKEGVNVEGVTYFFFDKKPAVKISNSLSAQSRENRLRTTLAHEFGHVHFHQVLVSVDFESPRFPFFDEPTKKTPQPISITCNRDSILNASQIDWVEWQAGYASCAILMPLTYVKQMAQAFYQSNNFPSKIYSKSTGGVALIRQLQETFQVSEDASRIRLIKLGYLTEKPTPEMIF